MAWKPQLKRILFIVSEDWYFVSHRLHLAVAAQRAGFEVGLLTNVSSHRREIEDAGIALFEWNLNRGSRNLFLELRAISSVLSTLRRFRPDLIHAVALKPVLYASLGSRLLRLRRRVFAMGGLGFAFSSDLALARRFRPLSLGLLRLALSGMQTRLILQNPQDEEFLAAHKVVNSERVRLIRGAGVDTEMFCPKSEQEGVPLIILPARMLWLKGVADFVKCAETLRERGFKLRFALVGEPDRHNPECVPESRLLAWESSGAVEWWRRRSDMPDVYAQSHVVCLPSSYEGLPKVLLEAASCGRPIVAYDIPGCREIVEHGVNGFLVPPRNVEQLCEAVASLVANPELRRTMGAEGRKKVTEFFSQEMIADQTRAVWDEILGEPPNSASLTNPAT